MNENLIISNYKIVFSSHKWENDTNTWLFLQDKAKYAVKRLVIALMNNDKEKNDLSSLLYDTDTEFDMQLKYVYDSLCLDADYYRQIIETKTKKEVRTIMEDLLCANLNKRYIIKYVKKC